MIKDIENKIDDMNKGFFNFFTQKKVAAAAIPNIDIETIRKAKWYDCIIEKSFIKLISSINVASEIKKTPIKGFFME